MKVLFTGGTGIISSGAAARALETGTDLWLLNRGMRRQEPEGARLLKADYRDAEAVKAVLAPHEFDAVIDFITFTPAQMRQAIELFRGRTAQYIFISSGTVYKKPLGQYRITEDAPLGNIHSMYARNKLACENVLREAIAGGFPGVIVRPSLTYSDFNMLTALNSRRDPYSLISRMRKGKKIVVHGDGLSLWTITHTSDFALGITGLLGNPKTTGEAFHITSDEVLDWNRIYTTVAHAAGVEANLIHIPSEYIGTMIPELRESLLGDHACSAVFDNSKIRRFVPGFQCRIPFAEGAQRCVDWFDADPAARETVDADWDAQMDGLIAKFMRAYG